MLQTIEQWSLNGHSGSLSYFFTITINESQLQFSNVEAIVRRKVIESIRYVFMRNFKEPTSAIQESPLLSELESNFFGYIGCNFKLG